MTAGPHLTVRVEVTPDALACSRPSKRGGDMQYDDQSSIKPPRGGARYCQKAVLPYLSCISPPRLFFFCRNCAWPVKRIYGLMIDFCRDPSPTSWWRERIPVLHIGARRSSVY